MSEGRGGLVTINNRQYLKAFRRKLRNNSTCSEAYLWNYLRKSQVSGKKIRRQHSIGNFILDFYCPSEKLAIELDGEVHFTPDAEANDAIRTHFLNSYGINVVRFENQLVFDALDHVISEIKKHLDHPLPPPLLRGDMHYLTLFDLEEYLVGYFESNIIEISRIEEIIPNNKIEFWNTVYKGRLFKTKSKEHSPHICGE